MDLLNFVEYVVIVSNIAPVQVDAESVRITTRLNFELGLV